MTANAFDTLLQSGEPKTIGAHQGWIEPRAAIADDNVQPPVFNPGVHGLTLAAGMPVGMALVHGSGVKRHPIFEEHDYFVASLRRTDFGRAHASIRLRTAQPMAASVC